MITASGSIQPSARTAHVPIDKQMKIGTLGFRCGLVGALAWFAMGVESVLRPFQDNRRETFWPLPFVLTIMALVCVHLIQRGRSRTERLGFATVVVASALMLVGNIGLQLNVRSLEGLGAPAGPVIWLVGLACFGVGTLQCGVLPRSAGVALILFEPSSILAAFALSPIAPLLPRGAYSGNLGKGIALAIVAFALRHVGNTSDR
ncbi:MAG: hypothetical protein JO150_12780 [Acidobacteriaceae bacterium]|nr:hypothetical protein [Acidobacteriaceae bacterium]